MESGERTSKFMEGKRWSPDGTDKPLETVLVGFVDSFADSGWWRPSNLEVVPFTTPYFLFFEPNHILHLKILHCPSILAFL